MLVHLWECFSFTEIIDKNIILGAIYLCRNINMVSYNNSKLSLVGKGQCLTDRLKSIAHNYLLLFSLVCSSSNILYVYTSALHKSNGSNLTSNQHNYYFSCTVAPPKYHTAVVHVHRSYSFTHSIEY